LDILPRRERAPAQRAVPAVILAGGIVLSLAAATMVADRLAGNPAMPILIVVGGVAASAILSAAVRSIQDSGTTPGNDSGPDQSADPGEAQEPLLRSIVDNLPALVSYVNREYRYQLTNATYQDWFGLSTDELRGLHIRERMGPALFDTVRPHFERAFAGEANHCELQLPLPSGELRWVDASFIPHFGPHGQVAGVVAMVHDISERKQSERDLQQSEERFRAIFNQAAVGITISDRDGRLLEANERACEILGYSHDELLGSDLAQITHADCLASNQETMQQLLDGSSLTFTTDKRYVRKDGSVVWVHAGISVLRDPAGEPWHLIRVFQDISDQKRAEDLLREESRTIMAINEIGGSLAAELDLQKLAQRIVDAGALISNAQVGAILYRAVDRGDTFAFAAFGLSADEFGTFCLPTVPDLLESLFAKRTFLRSAKVSQDLPENCYPFAGMPPDRPAIQSYLAAPIISRSGELVGGLFFGRELASPFADREEQLIRGIAAQAAIAIDNARLYREAQEAQHTAETANRMKDEFLATVSHELRTPLTAILGYAELLQRGKGLPAETLQGLKTIERSARAQAQIINDLLDVSRIISGKMRLDCRRVELQSVVAGAMETLAPAALAKSVQLTKNISPDVPPVWGDPERLQQIAWNLLSNAIKFTAPQGTVRISVEQCDGRVQLTVEDSGIGIEPAFLPYVFDRFRQVDSSTTRKYGGLGLGLAIVRNLVELHGGAVRADSPGTGQGATFIVSLPVLVGESKEDFWQRLESSFDSNLDPRELADRSLEGLRVLVVDDEPDARELVKRILEKSEAEVQAVGSAKSAIEAFAGFRPHVLVSDIGMPEQDGYDLIRSIRSLQPECGGDTPAVALTAFTRLEDQKRAINAGFQRHVGKPIEPDSLVALVADLARRS
jgi:PAS domain S-box-containing protein